MLGDSNQLSMEDFAKEIIGGFNERYNRDGAEAVRKGAVNTRACMVKEERGPSIPIE